MLQPHRPQAARASGCCAPERPSSWQGRCPRPCARGARGEGMGEPSGASGISGQTGKARSVDSAGPACTQGWCCAHGLFPGLPAGSGRCQPPALGPVTGACLSSSHSEIRGRGAQPSQGVLSAQRPSQLSPQVRARGHSPFLPGCPSSDPQPPLDTMGQPWVRWPPMAYARGSGSEGPGPSSPQRQRTGQPGSTRAQQEGLGPLLLSPRPWPTSYIKGLSVTAGWGLSGEGHGCQPPL